MKTCSQLTLLMLVLLFGASGCTNIFTPAVSLPDNAISSENVAQLVLQDRWGEGKAHALAYDSNQERLAIATTIGVRLYDGLTMAEQAFIETDSALHSLRFSPNGRFLAFVLAGKNVAQLWQLEPLQLLATLPGNDSTIHTLDFFADDKLLLGTFQAVGVWQVQAEGVAQTAVLPPNRYNEIILAPSGDQLAYPLTNRTPDRLQLWHLTTQQTTATLQATQADQWLSAFAFHPDGDYLAAVEADTAWGDQAKLVLWQLPQPEPMPLVAPAPISAASWAFSPNGRLLAAGLINGQIAVWETGEQQPVQLLTNEQDSPITQLRFAADGNSVWTVQENGQMSQWQLASGEPSNQLSVGSEPPADFQVTKAHLFTLAAKGALAVWDSNTGQLVTQIADFVAAPLTSVAFSADGATLATGSVAGEIAFWRDGAASSFARYEGNIDSVAFSSDGLHFASGVGERLSPTVFDDTVRLWQEGELRYQLGGEKEDVVACTAFRNRVVFSADGALVAASSHDFTVKVWSVANGRLRYDLGGLQGPVLDIAFAPNGQQLAAASEDGTVHVWQLDGGERLYTLPASTSGVSAVAFSPNGRYLLSGTISGQLHLWEAATGQPVRTFDGQKNRLSNLIFSPDGQLIAAGGSENNLHIWQVNSGKIVQTLTGHAALIRSLAFSPDGTQLISAANDTTIRLWSIP